MTLTVRQTTVGHAWVARPNHALTPSQTHRLILAAAAITGVIALAFTTVGAWPVLPFAGLEVAALWLALRYLQRRAHNEERLDVSASLVTVTRLTAGRMKASQFPRYWARLRIERRPRRHGCRLFLHSYGRKAEIGRLLTDAQRETLAHELKSKLGQA